MNHLNVFHIVFSLCIISVSGISQNQFQQNILDKFVEMQSHGSDLAIEKFITETYHPDLLENLKMDKHLAFYRQIIQEFGKLNPQIYSIAEQSSFNLLAYLIKENRKISDQTIDPSEILTIQIDLHKDDPKFMSRGLGLGALVCTLKENN